MADQFIMLLRHAEKPDGKGLVIGVTQDGFQNDEGLTIRGWERAGALAAWFSAPPSPLQRPAVIFASGQIKKDNSGSRSLRPIQTVTPLAEKLALPIDTRFTKGEEAELAKALSGMTGRILVSWQHENIPAIVKGLTGGTPAGFDNWPDKHFDMVWVAQRPSPSGQWTLTKVFQNLLPGDLAG